MSVSYRELMALRRAHIDDKQQQQSEGGSTNNKQLSTTSANHHLGTTTTTGHNTSTTTGQGNGGSPMRSPQRPAPREPHRPSRGTDRDHPPVPPGVDPKVFSSDVTVRGFVPKEELQRRKATAYELVNIETALGEFDIDYFRDGVGVSEAFGGPAAGALPLEAFDDTSFEGRSVADWKAIIAEGGPLKCVAVREGDDGRGRWADGHVQDWSATEGMLFVAFLGDEGSKGTWVPRVHVYLCSEDPAYFVSRVVSAMRLRKSAVGNLRHNLYVESMPVDDSQAVGNLVADRIRELAINTERILDNEGALDVPGLVDEINNDFAKTTNAQLFSHVSDNQRSVGQLMGDKKFARVKKAPLPTKEFGQVALAERNFPRIVRAFHKNTYLNNQDEVHLTLHRIRDECDHLMRNGIFVLSPQIDGSTPLTLEGFDDMQTTAVLQRALQLKENWCVNVREHIKDSLQHTSEDDDVNLTLSGGSKDAYEGSKLQRLVTTVRFQMQDTLFHLVTASLEAYVMYIERSCNFNVTIKNLAEVEAVRGTVLSGPLTLLPQIMGHDIRPSTVPDVEFPLPAPLKAVLQEATPATPSDPVVGYTLPSSDFLKVITGVFNKGITAMQEIPQIENQIVNFHLPAQIQTIASISVNHSWAQDWRSRLEVALAHATKPLDEYLNTYERFRDLVTLDVPTYIKGCEERLTKVRDLESEVKKHIDRERDILATVPTSVNLGTFHVDCVDLRKKLTLKCTLLAQKVLELMAKKARIKAEDVDDKFSTIRATLIRPLETPEDCVRTKEFIKTIPEQVYDLQMLINDMKDLDAGLDNFEFALSDDDFSKKWRAIGWPSRLDDEIIRRTHEIEQVKRTLTDGIEKSQVTFAKEVDKLQKTVAGFYKRTDIKKVSEIANEVRGILQDIQKCREQANIFNTHEGLFDREKSDYAHVHALSKDMEAYATLWLTTDDWLQWHSAWTNDPFDTLDSEEITNNTTQALKNMQKCCREPKFKDKVPILKIAEEIRAQIEDFKPVLPVLRYLRQDGMKDRHWNDLSRELSMELRPGATLHTLQDVYTLDLIMYEQQIMKVSEVAAREFDIERNLNSMRGEWSEMRLRVKPYKTTGCYIMPKDTVDDTQELLDSQLLTTQALSFSPFRKMFEQEIEQWEANVKLVQSVFDEWKTTQKAWMYLEPIFQSEDIARQLPAESKRFHMVNKNWKHLTGQAHEIDLTMPFCTNTENCLKLFLENNELLDKVQKGLNQYLENKRSSFARFYFLSDDELLTILSEAKDPQKIQPHFRKLFENCFRIDMRAPDNEMFGMYSQMDEYIPFREPVLPRKNVENWLSEIENMMRRSIRYELEKGMKSIIDMGRRDFVLSAPGQVAIAINQIFWTANCEKHLIEDGTLEKFVPTANENLMMLVETVRQKLTALQQMNLGGLITIEVHARDIVETLAAEKVSSVYAFEWVSQLRSYWENNDCYLRQVEAQFVYGGESLGNTTRLVITPLTDRIYLTLTGAMHMFLGSAPAGPAGTGKTETVKDLAKAVAKQCVVFNCQEGMTYASMGKFFKGLANAGAWACFDEFNRIDVEVLSVVAQQVSSLQEAARSGQYRIAFEGTEIVVDPSYSVFITMNPGYAGRTELPDNLKVLFRPVACMVPDYAMIAEIRLFSYGYAGSRKLARKMVATFRLSSEQLSSQDHYDFGMRAVNTVISAAGLMKRESPDEDEDVLLLRALRDSNAPKFLKEDLLLFSGIISDLFPGTELPARDYGNFQEILVEKCLSNQLQPTELFVKKCVEIFEMSVLRHGQMSVGPAMGGKSCVTRVLKEAMTKLRIELGVERFAGVETYVLNPKSITMTQLYGGFDEATGEWRDGLIGELFRIAASQTSEYRQWIIFDGPVDALWIESMNTVLDENKKLCLISGEIITMSPYMNIMFEVADLAVASPATVSRAGMIYMEPLSCIGIESFITSWQQYRLPSTFEPYRATLQKICEMLFSPLIQFVQTSVTEYSPSTWPNLIQSCFNIFSCFLDPFTPTRTYEVPEERLELLRDVHMPLLVFSIVWSFGVTGDGNSRKKFDRFLRDELRKHNVEVTLPDFGLLHDYEFLVEEKRWVAWTERAPAFTATVNSSTYNDVIVPTADVQRYKYINKLLLSKSYHTLNIGPTGTGKSVLISQLLFTDMPEEFTPIFFTFSARTGANQTQDLISSKFEARRRASPQIWGAPVGKKFVVFVDDLNMPMLEQYGAQPPVELLRQYTDYKGWYDRKNREFFNIVDVVLVSAMGPPGGGRNRVSQRFLRHFNQIALSEIDDANMKIIFTTILGSYFKSSFNDDVKSKLGSLVDSAIEIFDTVIKELRPTPSRPHYLFNMRDLAKIMGGMLDANAKNINSELSLAKLYVHETSRTFKDRLVDDHDREWFDGILHKQMQKHFKLKWNEIVTTDRLLFVDFAKSGGEARVYTEVTDLPVLVGVCEKLLGDYNNINRKQMNLVMFLDAVEHVCRAARVLKKPSGHLLLLGVGGSGRQSLSRFAAFINELDTFQIELSKGYGLPAWREDLKQVLRKVSFQNKQVMFLVTDTQIVHEGMLEDVNSLLNSGEVPNLFVGPDVDEIMTAMKPICVAEGVHLDKVNMYARFVKFCKTNLHVSVCMSPMGEPFRNRLRMFPALVNCCTIDWFSAWPDQALHSVAYNYFGDIEAVQDPTLVEGCIEMCVHIHQSVEAASGRFLAEARRYNYVTPTSYLELLYCFKQLMDSETKKNHTHSQRLLNGLEKLRHTEIQVSELQDTLAQSQPILVQKKEEIEQMVEQMVEETAKAEEVKVTAMSEQKVASAKQQECSNFEAESQAILDEAMPALDKALEALGNLQPSQLNEVAGYKVPTGGVRLTVQGLVILFQVKPIMKATDQFGGKKEPDYWQTAKDHIFNNTTQLLANMKAFHKNVLPTISERVINSLTPLVQDPAFEPETVRKTASAACVAMCEWAHAMHKYYFVNKQVQPLKLSLATAQADSKIAEEKLGAAQARLHEAEGRLAQLQAAKSKAEEDMRELEETVKNTEVKLRRAAMLIDGLAGEKKSWSATVAQLKEREKYLVGDMLCAAGQIAYLGAFTSNYRVELIKMWNVQLDKGGILHSDKLSVFDTMQDPVQTRQWNLNSLPADTLSIENALILTHARRWPLMIDPQMQANKWIRETYGDTLEVVKPISKDYIKKIEHCIRAGRPALLENISGEVDPSLDPLLNRQTFFEGGQEMIRVSDNAIPWNKDFKFFMTTKLANPHYIPEVMVKVTLLNFFITPSGLEDQLLGVLVGRERKELEDQKVYFVQQNASMRAQIDEIQRTILKKLEEVKGDILEDESLISYLNQSKTTTAEITEKVALAEETEREIDATREGYRSMANHSSILYFCCSQLSNVDPMYHYSLQWFVQLFISSIDSADKSEDLGERLATLKDYFTYSFYQNISRSLFEKHKLLFSFVLCIRILQGGGKVDPEEYRFLLQGPAEQLTTAPANPSSDWITDVTWRDLWYLDSKYEAFKGICASVKSAASAYKEIFLSASAHRAKLPGDWESKLTPIQRMLFIRCLRPDKLMDAVVDFVSSALGERFVKPPQFDLATSFKDATPMTPLVFILSPGADPFEEWKKFADLQRMSKKLSDISLGQGQGPRAERLLREGMESGMWVLLQNCHLATSWMPTLERLVESMTSSVHPQFRLWLTSMPNPHFPVAILQNGVKMTNEPPKGMRANVSRSLISYTDPMFERCKKPQVYRKLTFAMCFFHALIQERRKFGPLGWNIPYEYTTGDLNCCIQQIGMFLDKYDDVPYKVIRELSGQIHYGGRVTDDWDRRTITTILETFVGPEVLSDDYTFSPSGDFVSVPAVDQRSYLNYVDSWANNVAPEAFGLHDNADITCARNETFDTLTTIVALQGDAGATAGGGAKSADETVGELAAGILHRVRAPFDIAAFQAKFPTKYEDSMSTVVVQEAIRFNRLVVALRTSLQSIQLAIKGLMVMSKDLEELYRAILNNQVPTMWADKAYPSLKPLAGWVSDLVDRLTMIDGWYEKGHPKAYWIGGFYFPQAFLTGILQNFARQQRISIDTISYGFKWEKGMTTGDDVTEPPESGCYVYGMYIEGARIDEETMMLAESRPKVLFEGTPVLRLLPTVDREQPANVYKCPMYKTLRRSGTLSTTGHSTNYVLTAEIETPPGFDSKHWIKRGVAMICALNY